MFTSTVFTRELFAKRAKIWRGAPHIRNSMFRKTRICPCRNGSGRMAMAENRWQFQNTAAPPSDYRTLVVETPSSKLRVGYHIERGRYRYAIKSFEGGTAVMEYAGGKDDEMKELGSYTTLRIDLSKEKSFRVFADSIAALDKQKQLIDGVHYDM